MYWEDIFGRRGSYGLIGGSPGEYFQLNPPQSGTPQVKGFTFHGTVKSNFTGIHVPALEEGLVGGAVVLGGICVTRKGYIYLPTRGGRGGRTQNIIAVAVGPGGSHGTKWGTP